MRLSMVMEINKFVREYPSVSVIIPVRNEEKHIGRCIRNVMETSYPAGSIEIIVIDGLSTDDTRGQVQSLKAEGHNIVLLSNPKMTPYSGLNKGLMAAGGEVILRVDARSICPPDYIKQCVDTLLETGADNVGGVQKPLGQTPKQRAIALAMSHPFGVGNAQFRLGKKSGYVDTVYLGCFRKKTFEKTGLYDEDGPVISEDSEMNQRIIKNGGTVYLNKDIIISYVAKDSLKDFWRQYFIYGGARAHSFLRSRRFTSLRQMVPLVFLACLVTLPVLSFLSTGFLVLWGLIVITYIIFDFVVAAGITIKQKNPNLFWWLLLTFPCMHIAWPLGFFVRMFEGSRPGSHWRK